MVVGCQWAGGERYSEVHTVMGPNRCCFLWKQLKWGRHYHMKIMEEGHEHSWLWSLVLSGRQGKIGWLYTVGLCHLCKQNRGNGGAGCIVTAGGGHWSSVGGRGKIRWGIYCKAVVRATTYLFSQSIIQRLCRESSIVGSHIDKLREREDGGGKHQFILTLDITTVKWES